ncbi:cell division protein FtsZ [compost metagenome]
MVVGFGGAGVQIGKMLVKNGLPTSRLHLFDTDKRQIENNGPSGRYLLGEKQLKGKGTFSNTNLGKDAYEDGKEYLNRLSEEDCLYIVVGALGGGTFSAMAPLFAQTLASKNKKVIIVAKWPDGEEEVNIGIAHQALSIFNDITDKVILYKGQVVMNQLTTHGKENGYYEINKKISADIKDLLIRCSNRIIPTNTHEEVKLQDNFLRIKAYVDGSDWLIGQDDDTLYLTRANVALLDTIYSGHTELYINTPRKFEELTAEILRSAGYEAILTAATRDKGVDIHLRMPNPFSSPLRAVVQTKMKGKGKKIQRPEVQQLHGSRAGADRAMFVSSVDYSKDSIDFAKEEKIDLHRFFDLLDEYKQNYEGKVLRFPKPCEADEFYEGEENEKNKHHYP